jgi:hypothetical protein
VMNGDISDSQRAAFYFTFHPMSPPRFNKDVKADPDAKMAPAMSSGEKRGSDLSYLPVEGGFGQATLIGLWV